jgi:hypothetical protein
MKEIGGVTSVETFVFSSRKAAYDRASCRLWKRRMECLSRAATNRAMSVFGRRRRYRA